jgi:hypothetical protein
VVSILAYLKNNLSASRSKTVTTVERDIYQLSNLIQSKNPSYFLPENKVNDNNSHTYKDSEKYFV